MKEQQMKGCDNMEVYEKMYFILFNAITNALEKLDHQNYGDAKELLIAAQQETEERYIAAET